MSMKTCEVVVSSGRVYLTHVSEGVLKEQELGDFGYPTFYSNYVHYAIRIKDELMGLGLNKTKASEVIRAMLEGKDIRLAFLAEGVAEL